MLQQMGERKGENMISQQNLSDIDSMLEKLLSAETENKFYQSLQKQCHERGSLTDNQIICIKTDYQQKIKGNNTNNKEVKTLPITTPQAPAEDDDVNASPGTTVKQTHENWKNGVAPAPETISQQPSIEEFLGNYLESPDYGTREKITDPETIKTIIGLIKDRMVKDRSHYNGYNSKIDSEAKYEKTILEFRGNQMLKNGVALDCRLDDAMFDGMRINTDGRYSISILLDFYHPEHGFSLKCVVFDVQGVIKQRNKETITKTDKNTEHTQKTNTTIIGNTPRQTTLSGEKKAASATNNNLTSGGSTRHQHGNKEGKGSS